MIKRGNYSRGLIFNEPADLNSDYAKECKKYRYHFPMEGVYVYSFYEKKMLFTEGWNELVGIPDNEIGMVDIVNLSAKEFAPFVEEVNDKALMFLYQRNERLTEYCFQIFLQVLDSKGRRIPISAKVAVHDVHPNGQLKSITGVFRRDDNLRFGKVMRYEAFGPEKEEFEEALDPSLFEHLTISSKELQALKMAANGMKYYAIAEELGISKSAVEKRILPLFNRFEVRSLPELISFAYENYLIS